MKALAKKGFSISTIYDALSASLMFEMNEGMTSAQEYINDYLEYVPDYAITPLIITPKTYVTDPSGDSPHAPEDNIILTAQVTNIRWYLIKDTGNELIESTIGGDYSISTSGATKGQITIRKNLNVNDGRTLLFKADFLDTRTGVSQTISRSLSLTCTASTLTSIKSRLFTPLGIAFDQKTSSLPVKQKLFLGDHELDSDVARWWYKDNVLIEGDTTPICDPVLYATYAARVAAANGTIQDSAFAKWVLYMNRNLLTEGVCPMLAVPACGMVESSGKIARLFNMANSNDLTEATNRWYVGGGIAPNEKKSLKGLKGLTAATLNFTDSVYGASDSWTLMQRIKINKYNSVIIYGAGYFYITSTQIYLCNGPDVVLLGTYDSVISKNITIEFRYSNGTGVILVDGVAIPTTVYNKAMTFGEITFDLASSFDGSISYFQIISRVLTDNESASLHAFLANEFPAIDTVAVGTQQIATSNLEATVFGGITIPEVQDPEVWATSQTIYDTRIGLGDTVAQANIAAAMWCYYNNLPSNGAIYGKLYNFFAVAVMEANKIAGFHVPSNTEWATLSTTLGGNSVSGRKMKALYGGFNNAFSSNESGFSGIPGGERSPLGAFTDLGVGGLSLFHVSVFPYYAYLYSGNATLVIGSGIDKKEGISVRLFSDTPYDADGPNNQVTSLFLGDTIHIPDTDADLDGEVEIKCIAERITTAMASDEQIAKIAPGLWRPTSPTEAAFTESVLLKYKMEDVNVDIECPSAVKSKIKMVNPKVVLSNNLGVIANPQNRFSFLWKEGGTEIGRGSNIMVPLTTLEHSITVEPVLGMDYVKYMACPDGVDDKLEYIGNSLLELAGFTMVYDFIYGNGIFGYVTQSGYTVYIFPTGIKIYTANTLALDFSNGAGKTLIYDATFVAGQRYVVSVKLSGVLSAQNLPIVKINGVVQTTENSIASETVYGGWINLCGSSSYYTGKIVSLKLYSNAETLTHNWDFSGSTTAAQLQDKVGTAHFAALGISDLSTFFQKL